MPSIKASSVISLEHAATMKIAISIWNHRLADGDLANFNDLFKPFEIQDSIPLPNILTNRLNKYLDALAREIDQWMINHTVRIFPERQIIYLIPCLKHLVWRMNGTIDYDSTAKVLLEVDYLSELEKFEIAKSYFFLNYITEKWPKLSNDTIKFCFQPQKVFQIMLDASFHASRDQLIKMHTKFESFLNWYFVDSARIVGYKFSKIEPFLNTCHEVRIGIILHGSRYKVPIPK